MSATLGVQGYVDYRQLLEREDIDAVSICTTDERHVEPAVAAAQAGKHVFVEKPLALTPQECDRIIHATDVAGVSLMVGHILRFDPRYVAARQEISKGGIGDPIHLYIRRNNRLSSAQRLAGHTSALFFLGIHDIDFLNWCMGAKPERVYAQAITKALRDTPDAVVGLLTFPGGVVASLEASWVLPEAYPGGLDARFDAVGSAGMLSVDGSPKPVTVVGQQVEQIDVFYAPELCGDTAGILRDELEHFVRCIHRGTRPRVSGEDGRTAVEVACAIQESCRSGQMVQFV
jgi:UDP-N-acetylglucosamine 3-dehydrogenase